MKLLTAASALAFSILSANLGSSPAPWSGDFRVIRGDCLWKIAGISFNDPFLWPLIYDANRPLISNPDLIQPGWRLSMPLDPSDAEIGEARQAAMLYRESLPVPARAFAPKPRARSPQPAPIHEEAPAPARSRLPLDVAELTAIVYAFYLLVAAMGVLAVSVIHMLESPHHEKESLSPQGLHLAPWASINEISGNALPESYEEELKEAA